jgi:hypothetical protein
LELVVSSLKDIRPRPIEWLVPGLLPAGMLGLTAGEGGQGKSQISLELASAISVGRCAFGLDYPNAVAGESLLIQCEDDWERQTVPRLIALGADRSKIIRIEGVTLKSDGSMLDFHLGHYEQLDRLLRERKTIRFVSIDPAGAYIGRAGVNENKDADLRKLLGPLSESANRSGALIQLVKHLNKSAGASAVQRVSGSAGYVNACRVAYMVAPDPNDDELKVMVPIKANILPPGSKGIAYRLTSMPQDQARAALLREFPDFDPVDLEKLVQQMFHQEWVHNVTADANALAGIGWNAKTSMRAAEECAEFIRRFLGEWSWPDAEIETAALKAGFSTSAYNRAKTLLRKCGKQDLQYLGSKPVGEGGAWWHWIGPQSQRKPDRPDHLVPHSTDSADSAHTAESAESGTFFSNSLSDREIDKRNQSKQSQQSQQSRHRVNKVTSLDLYSEPGGPQEVPY